MKKCTKYDVCAINKDHRFLVMDSSKSIFQILSNFVHYYSFPFYHDYTIPIIKLSNFV